MRPHRHVLLFAVVLSLVGCATPVPTVNASTESEVMQRVRLLLDRYARNDQVGVLAMLDSEKFTIFGSDLRETIRTQADLRALMSTDFGQWRSAAFTDIREVDVRNDGTLATAYFVVTFSADNGPTLPLRISTTWRQSSGEWLLTQSANAVLTQR